MGDLTHRLSAWQRYAYSKQVEDDADLSKAEDVGIQRVAATWGSFQNEVFARLYDSGTPKLTTPAPGSEWAQKFHDTAAGLPEWQRLARRAQGDEWASGVATASIVDALMDALPADHVPMQDDPAQLANAADGMAQMIAAGDPDADAEAERLLRERLDEAVAQADQLAQNIDPDALRRKLRRAAEKAAGEIQQIDALCAGMGHDMSSGAPQASSPAVKAALAKRLMGSDKLRKVAELAGRMRRLATAMIRSRPQHGAGELSDIEQGNALGRLLPSQLVNLDDPVLELLFLKDYAERTLLQYKLQDRPKEGKGPIIFCLDESGSMEGDPDTWAKATFMGLAAIAEKEKRAYAIIHFESRVTGQHQFTGPDPMRMAEAVGHFSGGGTNFDAPLRRALALLEGDRAWRRADVVFVTDGAAAAPTDAAKRLQDRGVRIIGVGIGGNEVAASLTPWCDAVVTTNDIRGRRGAEAARATFAQVIGGPP